MKIWGEGGGYTGQLVIPENADLERSTSRKDQSILLLLLPILPVNIEACLSPFGRSK
jgi:hypothetical protein